MKSKWRSRMLWLNGLVGSLVVILEGLQTYLPSMGFDPVLTARFMFVLLVFTTTANFILRLDTTKGLR